MKLNHVKAEYRGKSFDFTPEKVNAFIGENGKGKTSLIDAVRYGITGFTPPDDPRGVDVEVAFDDGLVVERAKAKISVLKMNGKKATEKAIAAAIEDSIGLPLSTVKIASSSEVLLSTKPDTLLALLMEYLPEEIDFDTVMSYMTELTSEIESECSVVFPQMPEKFGIDALEEAYQYFYDEKSQLSKMATSKKAQLESLSPVKPLRDIKSIDDDIAEIIVREKRANEIKKNAEAYQKLVAQKKANDDKIAELKAKIANVVAKPSERYKDKLVKDREEILAKISECNVKIKTIENNIKYFSDIAESLDKPVCPISCNLVCTTDKSSIKEETQKNLSANQDLLKKEESVVADLTNSKRKVDDEISAFDVSVKEYQAYLRLCDELKAYQANVIVLPPEAKYEEPVDIEEEEDEKARLLAEKKNCQDWQLVQDLKQEVEEINRKAAVYKYIVSAFGDKGEVKNAILEYYFSTFEKVCNARAKEIAPEYEIKFAAESGLKILAKTPANKDFYPMEALSNGEQLICSFIVLDMLNQLSGARLLFVDNIEALDADAMNALCELIKKPELQSGYDHIFICGVNHKEVVDAVAKIGASYI